MMLSSQAGPDQPKPETNKRKSWQAAPGLAISAPDIPIAPGQVEGVAPPRRKTERS